MRDQFLLQFEGQSIVLLGFGREGQASYTALRKVFPEKMLAIADANDKVRENPLLNGDGHIGFITGPDYLQGLNTFDVIIRSPGIPLWNVHPAIAREKITSQTDIFLRAFASQVIGVTGTKGKSTTSSLIHHVLQTAGEESLLAGNIGNPAFHFLDIIGTKTKIVFELSSHQLEYIERAPHISVLLNLFQEHLDAYAGYEEYQLAKMNITKYQDKLDYLVYHADDPLVQQHVPDYQDRRRLYPFSLSQSLSPGGFIRDGVLCFSDGQRVTPVWTIHQDRFLRGEHNLKNILAALNVCMILGLDPEAIAEGIATFKGLEHRLEYVGEFRNIHFYNDSIATIPEACMEAVRAIPDVDTLLAGGFDRGIDYSSLASFLMASSVRNLILLGAAGKRIGEFLEKPNPIGKRIFYINRFDDFAAIAFRETRPGKACMLSPAAASYDEFNNFEERGKRFRMLVKGFPGSCHQPSLNNGK